MMVKTHLSLSANPDLKGVPKGWRLPVRDVLIFSGAKFLCPVTGATQPYARDEFGSGFQAHRCRCRDGKGYRVVLISDTCGPARRERLWWFSPGQTSRAGARTDSLLRSPHGVQTTKKGVAMAAKIIRGTEIGPMIRDEIKKDVEALKEKYGVTPGLVTILVGQDPASVSYVTAKQTTAKELGYYSIQENMDPASSEADLLAMIDKYNKDPKIHGILVQLPLPKHITETKILYAIDPDKDVDGFHPVNVGRLMIGEAKFYPCTPYGVQQMLVRSGVNIDGAGGCCCRQK